jgi:hypothetical protein
MWQASSVCDRLRNSTARAVVIAHTLLGDPSAAHTSSPQGAREAYFREVDQQGVDLLHKCKVWLGGNRYQQRLHGGGKKGEKMR